MSPQHSVLLDPLEDKGVGITKANTRANILCVLFLFASSFETIDRYACTGRASGNK